jgi:hypothetical protein
MKTAFALGAAVLGTLALAGPASAAVNHSPQTGKPSARTTPASALSASGSASSGKPDGGVSVVPGAAKGGAQVQVQGFCPMDATKVTSVQSDAFVRGTVDNPSSLALNTGNAFSASAHIAPDSTAGSYLVTANCATATGKTTAFTTHVTVQPSGGTTPVAPVTPTHPATKPITPAQAATVPSTPARIPAGAPDTGAAAPGSSHAPEVIAATAGAAALIGGGIVLETRRRKLRRQGR